MSEQQISTFVHVATAIVLLLGLGLVWLELRQAKSLTLAELASQGYSEVIENARTVMGENPAVAISKSCFVPDSLTHEDLVVLDSLYRAQASQIDRLRVLEAVADFGVPWQQYASQFLSDILAQEFGRWWFEENLSSDPELATIRDQVLMSNPSCQEFYERFTTR